MNCQDTQEQISQFIDSALSQELLQPMFQHVGDCDECRSFFVKASSIHNIVKQIGYTPAPANLDQKFSVMDMASQPLLERRITITVPSAMLSGLIVFMISFIMLFFLNAVQTGLQVDDQKPEAEYFKPNTLQMPYYN